MKKILTLVFASAFALTLSAPIASACPGMDGEKVVKEKKEQPKKDQVVVEKDKAKKTKKTKKKVKISKK